MPSIDQIVERAHKLIDDQPDYTIPKLIQWRKTLKVKDGKKLSACIECGTPIIHDQDKDILRCVSCRKKVSELYQKRQKKFCKNSTIETNL